MNHHLACMRTDASELQKQTQASATDAAVIINKQIKCTVFKE